MLREGPYAGHVAIIIKQSVPFPFMKLPIHLRQKVYKYLVKHEDDVVKVVLAQGSKKTAYSQRYKGKMKPFLEESNLYGHGGPKSPRLGDREIPLEGNYLLYTIESCLTNST